MQKIPTLFERDWAGDKSRVLNEINSAAAWIFDDLTVRPTRKWHGTACLWRGGVLWKRHDVRSGRPTPQGWWPAQEAADLETGHWPGWVMISELPEDRWHREALVGAGELMDGATYELIGPKVQGNPERALRHLLMLHGADDLKDCPVIRQVDTLWSELRDYLTVTEIEGIVWWGSNDRKVKLKARDFGIRYPR